jgi:hypothetical protein
MKTREELLTLIPQNTIGVEIGVFEGEFSKLIINTVQPSKFYMVDLFSGSMVSGDKNGNNMKTISLDESYDRLSEEYKSNDKVNVYKGKSEDFFKEIADDSLDFIYIDGDHSYEGAKTDLQNAFHKVKRGGLICGHDFTPRFQGVVDAVNQFVSEHNFELKITSEDVCASFCIINNK